MSSDPERARQDAWMSLNFKTRHALARPGDVTPEALQRIVASELAAALARLRSDAMALPGPTGCNAAELNGFEALRTRVLDETAARCTTAEQVQAEAATRLSAITAGAKAATEQAQQRRDTALLALRARLDKLPALVEPAPLRSFEVKLAALKNEPALKLTAASDDELAVADAAVSALEQRRASYGEALQAELAQAKLAFDGFVTSLDAGPLADPPECEAAETAPIAEARTKARAALEKKRLDAAEITAQADAQRATVQAAVDQARKAAFARRRKALMARFLKEATDPPGATVGDLAVLEAGRAKWLQDLPDPADAKVLEAAEKALPALLKLRADRVALQQARVACEAERRLAEARVAVCLTLLPKDPAAAISAQLKAVVLEFEAATSVALYQAAGAKFSALVLRCQPAEALSAQLDSCRLLAPGHAALTAAELKAKAGDLAGALADLNKLSTATTADPALNAKLKWQLALSDFHNSPPGADLKKLAKNPALADGGTLKSRLDAIRAPTTAATPSTTDYTAATKNLSDLKALMQAMAGYADRLTDAQALLGGVGAPAGMDLSPTSPLAKAIDKAKLLAIAGASAADYLKAVTELDAVPAKTTCWPRIRASAENALQRLETLAPGSDYTQTLRQRFDDAAKLAGPPDKNVPASSDALQALMAPLRDALNYRAAFMATKDALPSADDKLLDPARALAKQLKFDEGIAALKPLAAAAAERAQARQEWQTRSDEVALLQATVKDPTALALLSDVQQRAKVESDAGRHAEALAILAELRLQPALQAPDAAAAGYIKLLARLEARAAAAAKRSTGPLAAIGPALEARLDAARKLATTDPAGAGKLLKDLEPVLQECERYLAAHAGVAAMLASITRQCTLATGNYTVTWITDRKANAKGKAVPQAARAAQGPLVNESDGSTSRPFKEVTATQVITETERVFKTPAKPLADLRAKAEEKLGTLDFNEPLKQLALLRAVGKKLSGFVAKAAESADDGHSVDRHGPDVSLDDQKKRIEEGICPDGPRVPTQAATKFDRIEDWLATREMAREQVQVEMRRTLSTWTPDAVDWNPGEPSAVMVIIEHGRPIDSCVRGLKKKMQVAAETKETAGAVIEGDTYETYEVWTGLTRTRSNFEFKPENKAEKQKFDANQACRGRWVLHQQFPHPDDWDNERQCYTKPVPTARLS